MGSLSDYAENELLDHLFNAAYTPVATLYLGLCTADPTDAATGAACNEAADANGYARKAITFGAAAARKISQSGNITFDVATGAWGDLTHWVIVDSATHGAGNVLAHGSIVPTASPILNDEGVVASGQVEIEIAASVGAGFSTYAVNKLLDLMFRNQAFTSPAGDTFIMLLSVVADDADAATTDLTEVTGTSYVRTEVNPSSGVAPKWVDAAAGVVENAEIISLPSPGAADWDELVAIALVDAVSGLANVLAFDNATIVDQTPEDGALIQFAAAGLKISLS